MNKVLDKRITQELYYCYGWGVVLPYHFLKGRQNGKVV